MVHRKLSMEFEKWQGTAAEMKGQEMALRRGVMRMVHGKLAGAPNELEMRIHALWL